MANREHFYFYAPTWDYPLDGPIKLGNIVSSVKKPHLPLNTAPPSGVFRTEKRSVEYTKEKLRSGRFSILTKFLSVLGLGVDVGAEVERRFVYPLQPFGHADIIVATRKPLHLTLSRLQFIPNYAYLQKCVELEAVRRWLELSRYRKPIYVITGLKVVTGARAYTTKSRTVGGNLAVEVDGTIWSGGAVPIGGGPGVEGKVGGKQGVKWEGGNFVFAFRVSKIRVAKTGHVASETEFTHGAMMDSALESWMPEMEKPNLALISIEDPTAADEGLSGEELMEDDDVVLCAVPKE
ncbi:hypothetical protein FHETE_9363 [Fusarium heterosporum]|uniref:Uncharacterized protein n=1 Tax=Fusarium heterosporum TaxID=42747 RepID=A0A8H5SZ45_FUSHE|nr:hypothetical protein FHETE_9363 [Fusarium heterosporum]